MTNHRDSDVLGKYTAPAAPVQEEEMKAGEHTPTPWSVERGAWVSGKHLGRSSVIATCDDDAWVKEPHQEANAAFIVQAVNSHEGMIAKLSAAYQRIDELEKERAALLVEIDPPICRLQFPDGSVPRNAREAAEGWHRWYNDISKLNDARRKLIDAARIEGFLEPFPAESGA